MGHECNDFIIRDEKFVREFEEMYRSFEDPWNQKKNVEKDLMNQLAIELLSLIKIQGDFNWFNTLDIGCGPGHISEKLHKISNIGGKLLGLDISSHAIIEAKKNNLSELIDYKVANIL